MKTLRALLFLVALPLTAGAENTVTLIKVEGVINPVITEHVLAGIKKAEESNAQAVLIELNTPGGLLDATRDMIGGMVNSPLPVIVYVTPRGSRATSAGVFIMMASDIAAMTPETHLGAAHPVNIGGETPSRKKDKDDKSEGPSVMEEKMVSDAAAYIRSLAADKGRPQDWPEKAVRESVSLTAGEALEKKVIEHIFDSRAELFEKLDGKTIANGKKPRTLQFKGVVVNEHKMSKTREFLNKLAHPNVAYILMMIGIYGLIYELAAPGIGLGGIIGGICLLLAFLSMQVLPINTVGAVLLALGIALMVTEFFTPTHGVLGVGGLIAFAVGSFLLIDIQPGYPYPRVSPALIVPTVATTGAFFMFVIARVLRAHKRKPATGRESLIGAVGVVKETLSPQGLIFLNGELWSAKSNETLNIGERAQVEAVEGNLLIVKKSQ